MKSQVHETLVPVVTLSVFFYAMGSCCCVLYATLFSVSEAQSRAKNCNLERVVSELCCRQLIKCDTIFAETAGICMGEISLRSRSWFVFVCMHNHSLGIRFLVMGYWINICKEKMIGIIIFSLFFYCRKNASSINRYSMRFLCLFNPFPITSQ